MKEKILEFLKNRISASLEELIIELASDETTVVPIIDDLLENYDIFITRKGKYALAERGGYYKGNLSLHHRGYGFLDFKNQPSLYINRKNINGAMNNDSVVVKRIENSHQEAKVIKILKRKIEFLTGKVSVFGGKIKFLPFDEIKNNFKIRKVKIKVKDQDFVIAKIIKVDQLLHLDIVDTMKVEDVARIDVLSIMANHGVFKEFSQDIEAETLFIKNKISIGEIKNRKDFRKDFIITIDNETAKDLDDAISVHKKGDIYYLGVHIADVSHYVKEGSLIDKEAYYRGNSTYALDQVAPMLPKKLSNGVCSLNPGEDRLTLSCLMTINSEGKILDYEIMESVINSSYRMTYTNVNDIIQGNVKENDLKLVDMLLVADSLSKVLSSEFERRGSINFDIKESFLKVDRDGRINDISFKTRLASEILIENFMVITNYCVARHLYYASVPAIYRVHDKPEAKNVRELAKLSQILGFSLKGDPTSMHSKSYQTVLKTAQGSMLLPILSSKMLRSLPKAYYSNKCKGHFGLGIDYYTHFTSPIRRYSDLMVHRLIKHYLFKYNPEELDLSEIAQHVSITERVSIDIEREVESFKKAEYMEQFIGQTFYAIIVSVTDFGFFIQLSNSVEGLVHISTLKDDYYEVDPYHLKIEGLKNHKVYKLGDRVKVCLKNSNKEKRQIDFIIEEENEESNIRK